MKIIAPYDTQLELFSHRRVINATCTADARNAYGEAAQEIVVAALGLKPVRINGSYTTCFDAYRDGVYYEIKSVKAGGKVVCYDWRMEKEAASGVEVVYAILVHRIRYARVDIVSVMSAQPLELYTIPAYILHEYASRCPLYASPKTDKQRVGYTRTGYCDGYRNVTVKGFKDLQQTERIVNNPYGGTILWREIARGGS